MTLIHQIDGEATRHARAKVIKSVDVYQFGRMPYALARAWQLRCVEERTSDRYPDALLVMEHDPVFTMGRRTKPFDMKTLQTTQSPYPVIAVERGGSVTYHGPGQLVCYPILRLRDYCHGPKMYVHLLEEVVLRTLDEWGLLGYRRPRFPGVWVEGGEPAKIASVGVHIRRGVTMHGFSLNVSLDLAPFGLIEPCGIPSCPVTSMAEALGSPVDAGLVRRRLVQHFQEIFNVDCTPSKAPTGTTAAAETP
jgi:lipoate-protein ligase B